MSLHIDWSTRSPHSTELQQGSRAGLQECVAQQVARARQHDLVLHGALAHLAEVLAGDPDVLIHALQLRITRGPRRERSAEAMRGEKAVAAFFTMGWGLMPSATGAPSGPSGQWSLFAYAGSPEWKLRRPQSPEGPVFEQKKG